MRTPPDATDGWDDDLTAAAYYEFTQHHTLYPNTSHDLVSRAGLTPTARVLDLCGGTGATAQSILRQLGPDGRVVSIDSSAAMQRVGRLHLRDPRLSWLQAGAEDFASRVHTPVDAVVCNSALWKTDLTRVLPAVREVLRPGGLFVFNIGGAFAGIKKTPGETRKALGLNSHIEKIAQEDFGYRPPLVAPNEDSAATCTSQRLELALATAGLRMMTSERVSHLAPIAEKRAWLAIPVFSRPMGFADHATRLSILERAWGAVDQSSSYRTDWLVVTARR